jgi:putative addiction module component (TIGR02574 family)
MTLAALKKEVLRLPLNQRIKLANAVFESLPSAREPLTFEELEKRADEALSGSVKMIPAEQFHREARTLVKRIARRRVKAQSRSGQRG